MLVRPLGHRSEAFDPRSQLYLQGPGAARLAQDLDVGLRDSVRIKGAVRAVRRIGTPCATHAAVDDEMRDMDAFRPQLARGALRQAAQRKLAHREGSGMWVSLDAGAGTRQQDRAA